MSSALFHEDKVPGIDSFSHHNSPGRPQEVVTLVRLHATGRKTRYIYGKRREEVREKLTKAIADRDGGLVYDADNLTVGEYLDRWLNDSVRDTVRQRTWERYEQFVRVHLTRRWATSS